MLWLIAILGCSDVVCEPVLQDYCRDGASCMECRQGDDSWVECDDDQGPPLVVGIEAAIAFCWEPGAEWIF